MLNLTNLTNSSSNTTMSSTEIAALTGKDKKLIHRDIRTMLINLYGDDKLDKIIPEQYRNRHSEYIREHADSIMNQLFGDGSNWNHQELRGFEWVRDNRGYVSEYYLDKEHTITLISGYNVKMRNAITKRWLELESTAITPPQLPAKQIAETAESMVSLATIFGLSGNQALLSADRATFKLIGHSPLKLLEIQLESDDKDRILTPTEIAPLIHTSSAVSVNKILESLGYQYKDGKVWHMTEKGKPYGVLIDVGKSNGGTPVQQLKWKREIVDLISA